MEGAGITGIVVFGPPARLPVLVEGSPTPPGRALVEAWVIVYVFTTRTRSKVQTAVLIVLEAALLTLITLTLGPAFRAIGAGERMYESLTYEGFWLWNFGVAAYTSVMMAAAGIAYRMQPEDVKAQEPVGARRGIDVLKCSTWTQGPVLLQRPRRLLYCL